MFMILKNLRTFICRVAVKLFAAHVLREAVRVETFGCGNAALGFIPTPRWGYCDA